MYGHVSACPLTLQHGVPACSLIFDADSPAVTDLRHPKRNLPWLQKCWWCNSRQSSGGLPKLPGLVNIQKAMERSTMLVMGKSTISMAIFNSFLYVYQRVGLFFGGVSLFPKAGDFSEKSGSLRVVWNLEILPRPWSVTIRSKLQETLLGLVLDPSGWLKFPEWITLW